MVIGKLAINTAIIAWTWEMKMRQVDLHSTRAMGLEASMYIVVGPILARHLLARRPFPYRVIIGIHTPTIAMTIAYCHFTQFHFVRSLPHY